MLNFDFLEKGLALASPPKFVYDFLRKIILILYFAKCNCLFAFTS